MSDLVDNKIFGFVEGGDNLDLFGDSGYDESAFEGVSGVKNITDSGRNYTGKDFEKEVKEGGAYSDLIKEEGKDPKLIERLTDIHISTQELKDKYVESTSQKVFYDEQGNAYKDPMEAAIADGVLNYDMPNTQFDDILLSPEFSEKYPAKILNVKNPQSREAYNQSIDEMNLSFQTEIIETVAQGLGRPSETLDINLNLNNLADNIIISDKSSKDALNRPYHDIEANKFYFDIMSSDGRMETGYEIVAESEATPKVDGYSYGALIEAKQLDLQDLQEIQGKLANREISFDTSEPYQIRNKETGEKYLVPVEEIGQFLKNIGANTSQGTVMNKDIRSNNNR